MTEVKSYKPGMFSWADLSTSDVAAAKRFYGELLGWKGEDLPMGPDASYTLVRRDGREVAGIAAQRIEEQAGKVPPHWNTYFTVANVDEMAAKVKTLGGKIIAPPVDVMDAGRMAVIADPSGAVFSLWQPKKLLGAAWVNDAGGPCWSELATSSLDACGSFYGKLFGWTPKAERLGETVYTTFNDGRELRAGMMALAPMAPKGSASRWTIYFGTENCDKRTVQAKALGAKVVVEPKEIPNVGRFSMMFDPQGALFALLQPKR